MTNDISNTTNTTGTTGDDRILGDPDYELLGGGDGDDEIIPGGAAKSDGTSLIDGGDGTDTVNFGSSTLGSYGGAPNGVDVSLKDEKIYDDGYGESATIENVENVIGTASDDVIEGDDGDNVIEGGGGQDTLFGLGGDDTFIMDGVTGSLIDGGDHTLGIGDTVDYSAATGNLTIDLENGRATEAGFGLEDTLSDIENVVTGKGDDTIILMNGVRNHVVHTTNADADGNATGVSGNGGTDTVVNFQIGSNVLPDGSANSAATFDVIDLSSAKINYNDRGSYISISNSSGDLLIKFSASGNLTSTDVTEVLIKDLQIADVEAAYGLAPGSLASNVEIIDAMFNNGSLIYAADSGTPQIEVDQQQVVVEGQSLVLDGVNQINVSDLLPDNITPNVNGMLELKIQIRDGADPAQAGFGQLKLGSRVPTELTDGNPATGSVAGDGTISITLVGTIDQLNLALADLEFVAAPDNEAKDQILRFTLEDADNNVTVEEMRVEVMPFVESAAAVRVDAGKLMLDDGESTVALGVSLALPADADNDGSEVTKVEVRGVPAGTDPQNPTGTLTSSKMPGAVSSDVVNDQVVWTIQGTQAEVDDALSDLTIEGLTFADYPVELEFVAVTTDTSFEGKSHVLVGKPVSMVIDGYAEDINGNQGQQVVTGDDNVKAYGTDSQADQLVSGAGANHLVGNSSGGTDGSIRDMVYYSIAPGATAITEGVDVNLELNRGKGGFAEGDTYENIEGAFGTEFNDRFVGAQDQRNTFFGGEGDDEFVASLATDRNQDDTFNGGAGSDTLSLENLGVDATVNLNQSSQDFDGDGTRDARIFSIENVVLGSGNDTLILKASTLQTIGGAQSGDANANTVYLKRLDGGVNAIQGFDVIHDRIDLSGALKTVSDGIDAFTGKPIWHNHVTVVPPAAAGDPWSISVDKVGAGNVADIVVINLEGVDLGALAAAAGAANELDFLVDSGALVVEDLQATDMSVQNTAEAEAIEGGMDVGTLFLGLSAPKTGDQIEIIVGKSQLIFNVTSNDLGEITNALAEAINAATNLDSVAVVRDADSGQLDIRFDSDVSVEIGDVSATLTRPNGEVNLVFGGFSGMTAAPGSVELYAVDASGKVDAFDFRMQSIDPSQVSSFVFDWVDEDGDKSNFSQVNSGNHSDDMVAIVAGLYNQGVAAEVDVVGGGLQLAKGRTWSFDNTHGGTDQDDLTIVVTEDAYNVARIDTSVGTFYAAVFGDDDGSFSKAIEGLAAQMVLAGHDVVALGKKLIIEDANITVDKYAVAHAAIYGSNAPTTTLGILYTSESDWDLTAINVLLQPLIGGTVSTQLDRTYHDRDNAPSLLVTDSLTVSVGLDTGLVPPSERFDFDQSTSQANEVKLALSGTVVEGSVYSVDVEGVVFSVVAGAADTLETIRDALIAEINADQRGWNQETKLTLDKGLAWLETDVYRVDLGGTVVSYTVAPGDDFAAVRQGLIDAINDAAIPGVTAAIGGSREVIWITSEAVLVATAEYDVGGAGTTVSDRSDDLAVVVEFNDGATPLAEATADPNNTDGLILTANGGGVALEVSPSIQPPAIKLEQGEQYYYAYDGISETFVWTDDRLDGDDTISGFNLDEDVVDLSQVLSGASNDLLDYLTVTNDATNDSVTIAVDVDGDAIVDFNILLKHNQGREVSLADLVESGVIATPVQIDLV